MSFLFFKEMQKTMKIIDAHTHIFPEKIASKAVKSVGNFYDMEKMSHEGTSEALLASGEKIGVLKYLVCSTATTKEQVEPINRFIISECEKHAEFLGLGTMHIEYEDFEKEVKFLKEQGIKGIKIHPDFQRFAINDKRLFGLYELLSAEKMFLLTHSGDYRYEFSNPAKVCEVAKQFPKLNIIAAHFGGWSEWDEAEKVLNLENVYFDTSSTIGFGAVDKAYKVFNKMDKSHFFFGTDFPMWDHEKEFNAFMELKISDDFKEDILYNNFKNFYGLE